MAQLFSKGTIAGEVSDIAGLDIADRIAIVKKLHTEWKAGNADDETRYEQNFNQLFFNELLGYNRNTHMHPKASTPVGGKIADIGLGHFTDGQYVFADVQVVVELKGAKIFLDKKQQRQNSQSPVDQGFGYKTSFKNCKWLIVSNFHQIRLYRDNKQDYEEWTLDELISGEDNYFALRKLLMILSAKRLLAQGDDISRTEKLMTQFRIDQQKITKKFYQEYKGLRLELIHDMREKNPSIDIETIVEKAQKIIDRVVFVHFCEDKGLLPADKLKEVINYGEKALAPVWQTLSNFFEAVNSGSPKLEIPKGYNGGLFKTDEALNSLRVGDEICKKFVDMGDYDFDDELSVNILGHIFEQSISDLEELKLNLVDDSLDSSLRSEGRGKRKKDGIFYTPEYIVDYIVQNSLMKYLNEKEDECLAKVDKRGGYKTETEAYQAYQQILHHVKVLDPACGSGAFLVRVFDVLLEENKRVGTIIGGLFDESETYKNILTNNIYGVDLNPESVEITKLSLWLKSAQKGKKLNNLDKNIKCGNSLIDDQSVAGQRAFDWNEKFKAIMDEGGFDVIVGNPPYGAELPTEVQKYLSRKYIKGGSETAISFIKLCHEFLLKSKGLLGFIIPKSFSFSSNYSAIRESLFDDISEIIDCKKVWKEVKLEQVMLFFSKDKKQNNYLTGLLSDMQVNILGNISKETFKEFGFYLNGISSLELKVGQKINSSKKYIKDIAQNSRGGIFQNKIKDQGDTVVLGGAEIQREGVVGIKGFIDRSEIIDDKKCFINKNSVLVQRIIAHIENPTDHIKIVACLPEKLDYSIVDTINQITFSEEYNAKVFWLLFNSTLINRYSYRFILAKAIRTMQFDNPITNRIPIPLQFKQQPFIDKADQMLALNKEFHEKKSSALALIQAEYGIEKVSRKLESFWELDFADFLKAMKVKSLSLEKKEELMARFTKKKEELAILKSTIDQVDREIDGMVYELYGLTDEEVKVVEGG